MPTSDRHHAALSAATDTYRATPVGATALPRLATRALDAEQARTAAELERAHERSRTVDETIQELQATYDATRTAITVADAAAAEAGARHVQLESEAEDASHGLRQVEERLDQLNGALPVAEASVDALTSLVRGLDDALAEATDRSRPADQLPSTADALDRVAEAASAHGADDARAALAAWATALRDGTAPLHSSAVELLVAFGELEREWDEHGRGDLMAEPSVVVARSALDEARTLRDDIEAQANAGALGARAMSSIRVANARRSELEALGHKAGADQLRAAIDAETEALQLVGFDSMLDFQIAMSTGGPGSLVDARRATAAERVLELESELALRLAEAVALHAALRVRFDQLRTQTDDLVGEPSDRPIDEALRGVLAVPDEVHSARVALGSLLQESIASLDAQRQEQHDLATDARAMDLRRAVASSGAVEAAAEIERSTQARAEADTTLATSEQALDERRQERRDVGVLVEELTRSADELADRAYLDEDRREFTGELIAALVAHAHWLAGGTGSEAGSDPTAIVVDDPLDDLTDADAVHVVDELVTVDWPLPLIYVTSRSKLVQRLRHDGGAVRCVDGRRRASVPSRWRRRRMAAESLRG